MGTFTYKLTPRHLQKPNTILADLDRKRRNKVEEAAGKPMTDAEWLAYKQMTIPKPKNS